jgi:hypothetical protein
VLQYYTGRFMPFMFVWSTLLVTPLIMSTGMIGMTDQFIGQIAALTILRKKQPGLKRPYKQWLYPVPSIIALADWIYIFQGAGWSAIRIMLAWTGLGIVAFLIWARIEHTWPFGPKLIWEQFLEEQQAEPVRAEHRNAA